MVERGSEPARGLTLRSCRRADIGNGSSREWDAQVPSSRPAHPIPPGESCDTPEWLRPEGVSRRQEEHFPRPRLSCKNRGAGRSRGGSRSPSDATPVENSVSVSVR